MTDLSKLPLDTLDGLSDKDLLSALLTYTQPNEAEQLAARLLSHFGSLSAVLHGENRALTSCGASAHTCSLLAMLLPAYGRIMRSRFSSSFRFDSPEKIGEYFSYCFCGSKVETVYLLLLRADYTVIECRRMASGSVNSANLNVRSLVEAALFSEAKFVAIAHNHPSGLAQPSQADISTTLDLRNAFSTIGVTLLDHIIVAGNSRTSVLSSLHTYTE
ncbi:MAG: JAB domain-containing protein [Clostridia bacterium]|nr:JAB domain-containing protein [Clostridia bacterium]